VRHSRRTVRRGLVEQMVKSAKKLGISDRGIAKTLQEAGGASST